jgi:hypothetical protein
MSIFNPEIVVTEVSEITGFVSVSIDATIKPTMHSAVNQGFPMVLLPDDFLFLTKKILPK